MVSDRKLFISLFIIAALIFLAHFLYTKTAVYGDGRFYYSYLPTFLLDHTLSFVKSFKHFGITSFSNLQGPANIYPIGPAIFWSIPFTIANLILIPFGKANGYRPLYDILIGLWNISFVIFGIYLLKKTLLKFFTQRTALLSSLAIFTATNLLFYGAVDVINSHSASFFFSALFLYLFVQKRNLLNSILLGITIGLLALVRSQDYLFLIFPVIDFLKNRKNLLFPIITILTAFTLFLPQVVLWHVYYGGLLTNPYLKVRSFDFLNPHLIGVFFNRDSGIVWTPIVFVCLYGLFGFLKKNFYVGFYSMLLIFMQVYLIASWSAWWEGASFSARMLVSSLPFLSIGLAYFLESKKIIKYDKWIVVLFSIGNAFLIILFLLTR